MGNVLIVESDVMVAHILETYLQKDDKLNIYGPVSTLEEILHVLKKYPIDLILLAAYLPKKSGLEVLQILREKKYYDSVIMVTAANSVEEIRQAYAYGVVDYILKPFDRARFEIAIKKYKIARERVIGKSELSQEDLDRDDSLYDNLELPKGLNRTTYLKILEKLKEVPEKKWTLREFASEIKISNVTVKKYTDYLVDIGLVEVRLNYGQVGRPEYRFFLRT